MPVAISPDAIFKYQLLCDRKVAPGQVATKESPFDPTKTIFDFAPLRPKDEARIDDSFITYGNDPAGEKGLVVSGAQLGARTLEILRLTLRGWTNFPDADGRPVSFDPKDQDENIARIAPEHRHELAGAALARTKPTAAESD